jgi:hypothetical protein
MSRSGEWRVESIGNRSPLPALPPQSFSVTFAQIFFNSQSVADRFEIVRPVFSHLPSGCPIL